MPTEEQISERLPTWLALSEFFLDDELALADHQRIAAVLAGSSYTEKELTDILRHEVYPECSLNLICVAGAWGAWSEDWIRERIAPRYDHRPRLYPPAFNWGAIQHHWNTVKNLVLEYRTEKRQAT